MSTPSFTGRSWVPSPRWTLDYVSPNASRSRFFKRATVGGFVRIAEGLVGQMNVSHQPGGLAYGDTETAADFALTYTVRFGK
jgi:hypothetical protein